MEENNMKHLSERKGISVNKFNIGDKVLIVNPFLLIQSANEENDTFTVEECELSFGKWKAVRNDRTGFGYVMSDGDYCLV
jgi:hypothetical protein